MKFTTRKVNGVIIFDIEGKILLGEGDVEIKVEISRLLDEGERYFILNLAKCPYIDSSGFGEIIRSYTAVRKSGGRLVLLSLTQRVNDLFEEIRLKNVFDLYSSEEEAVREVRRQ